MNSGLLDPLSSMGPLRRIDIAFIESLPGFPHLLAHCQYPELQLSLAGLEFAPVKDADEIATRLGTGDAVNVCGRPALLGT